VSASVAVSAGVAVLPGAVVSAGVVVSAAVVDELPSVGAVLSAGDAALAEPAIIALDEISIGVVGAGGAAVEAGGVAVAFPGSGLGVRARVRTTEVDGGDPQGEVAALAAVTLTAAPSARETKIIPTPTSARPMATPSAVGLRSSALTRCNLASVSRPGTLRSTRFRHTTHGFSASSGRREIDTEGS
ncbi:MAG: hypothetical protein J2P29_11320, partial [Actinobacteria bacterium]|nr:hypothetical protein [Actinomycetota bacterium]